MTACGSCGVQNRSTARFCTDCGAALGAVCPSCSAAYEPAQRFCSSCGQALPAPTTALTAPAAVAERRVCSVLFVDLVGFTPLAERLDPEEVRELLSRYFECARTIVGRYGGVIEKFIGDAVMAVWGAPVTTEGDAERCVRAALDLLAAVPELGTAAGLEGLAARAGVVTGEIAITVGQVGEGLAGDPINTAARVQSAAPAGVVLVDAVTRRLTDRAVQHVDAGEHDLKGKTQAQRLWRAVRILAGVGGTQRVDGLEAPLTGRDGELRAVKELFHASADRGQPRLVLISGPAGVGKSRLGWEFEKYVDGLYGEVYWHRGRCLSYGDGVAFWALAEIVRQRFGIGADDAMASSAATLRARLPEFVPAPDEQLFVGPRLARLLGVPYEGADRVFAREELFAGWRVFFERLAATEPLVLLIEDVQHADDGLLAFLDHLLSWSRDLPIFVLGLTRPELEERRPGLGIGRNRTTLTLDPLDGASMDELLEGLVPGMPPTAKTAIARQAQGIPLFAVETIRSLIDRDVVVPRDGRYTLVGDLGELAVPDSLHALLAARLDSLSTATRALLADAAVLGSSFPLEALVAVSGQEAEVVVPLLGELMRRDVLEVSADPLSPEQGSYRFGQQMLRQVAYETLSRRDRKTRHLAVAAHLRATFSGDGEEVIDVVAQHYVDALAAMPGDADVPAIRAVAVQTQIRAAERARDCGSPGRAAAGFVAAANLADADAAAALLQRAAVAALADGADQLAIDLADRARTDLLARDDERGAASAAVTIGTGLRRAGRHVDARRILLPALDVLRRDPTVETVVALGELAQLEAFDGTVEAGGLADEALVLGQALGVDRVQLAHLLIGKGIWLTISARRAEAEACFREALRLADVDGGAGSDAAAARALLNLGGALAAYEPAAAVEAARACDRRARLVDRGLWGVNLMNLIGMLLATGEWDEARAVLGSEGTIEFEPIGLIAGFVATLGGELGAADTLLAGVSDMRSSQSPQDMAMVSMVDAFHAEMRGDLASAYRLARASCDAALRMGTVTMDCLCWAWALAARTALELDDRAAVRELVALLDALPRGILAPALRAERELVRARMAASEGGGTDAVAAAVRGLRTEGSRYDLALGLLDLAVLERRDGDPTAFEANVAEARAVAEALGSRPLLERAAALAPTPEPAVAEGDPG